MPNIWSLDFNKAKRPHLQIEPRTYLHVIQFQPKICMHATVHICAQSDKRWSNYCKPGVVVVWPIYMELLHDSYLAKRCWSIRYLTDRQHSVHESIDRLKLACKWVLQFNNPAWLRWHTIHKSTASIHEGTISGFWWHIVPLDWRHNR